MICKARLLALLGLAATLAPLALVSGHGHHHHRSSDAAGALTERDFQDWDEASYHWATHDANAAAAGANNNKHHHDDDDEAGAEGRHHHHHRHRHRHHHVPGCLTAFHEVDNLLTLEAIECSECLTSAALRSSRKTSAARFYGRRRQGSVADVCEEACENVPQGSEFFVPLPNRPLVTTCLDGLTCYQGINSTSECQCCGRNLGMNYNMPSAPATDFLGEVSNFKRNCDLPISASNCQACTLWRKLRGGYIPGSSNLTSLPCTQGERCFETKDRIHTLMGTAILGDPYHYLLLPGSKDADWPVIGIEDPQVLTRRLEHIWNVAWLAAYRPYKLLPFTPFRSVPDLPVSNTSCNIGIALNPASARSQHQMHIHIARVPTPLRQLFVGRRENFGTWTKLLLPITRQPQAEWPIAYARFFSLGHDHNDDDDNDNTTGTGTDAGNHHHHHHHGGSSSGVGTSFFGPGDLAIFHQAFEFASRSFLNLQAWGIMIIPVEEAIDLRGPKDRSLPRGFYLVLSTNNVYGSWNPYAATALNERYEPEILLCTAWSTGAGSFWTPEECFADLLATAPAAYAELRSGPGSTRRFTDGLVAQQLEQQARLLKL